ncbi:hypothetical protein J6590_107739, partial [Homalodisca vitripennis]
MERIVVFDPTTKTVKVTVPLGQLSEFKECSTLVSNKNGDKVEIKDIIGSNSITMLLFGNCGCEDTLDLVEDMKKMWTTARNA